MQGFGPFYAVATYAFVHGRELIRLPTMIWASVMMTNVAHHHVRGDGGAAPGPVNRVAVGLMARRLPRRTAIGIMAGQTGDLARG